MSTTTQRPTTDALLPAAGPTAAYGASPRLRTLARRTAASPSRTCAARSVRAAGTYINRIFTPL
jgi:hypothetical protein